MRTSSFVKLFGLLILLSLIVSSAFSQGNTEDVIYLKNGSVIRGQILVQKFGEFVKIESSGHNVWVFSSKDIDRIVKEDHIPPKKWDLNIKEKGYFNITDVGVLAGRDSYQNKYSFSFLLINGYQLKNRLSFGLGTGLEFMDIPLAPAFIDIRHTIFKGKLSPFVAVRGGYSFPLVNYYENGYEPRYQGGYMVGSVIGIKNYITDNAALVLSVGFRHQQLRSTRTDWFWAHGDQVVQVSNFYNRIAIRVGLHFN